MNGSRVETIETARKQYKELQDTRGGFEENFYF